MIEKKLALRNRIIGLLLRDAREKAGRTKTECAEALDVSPSTITAYEEGQQSISLPELEVLTYLLNTPVDRFWEHAPKLLKGEGSPKFQRVLGLRQRIVGTLLRQARQEKDITQKELAEVLDCSPSLISDYEHGEQAIPMAELETLARHLQVPMEYFLDDQAGPVGAWHRQQQVQRSFQEIPPEMQEFVIKPVNIKYLEVAMRLAKMPAGGLRSIAEGLLEITY
jgi:transcriptional regulator with XRE-family HTH domain